MRSQRIVFALIASADLVLFSAIIGSTKAFPGPKANSLEHCTSDQQKQQETAVDKYDMMDLNVHPCDNFYEYACGNWRVPYRLRILGAHDTLTSIKAANKRTLIEYFETASYTLNATTLTTSPSKSAVTNFYNSCLDVRVRSTSRGTIRIYTNVLRQFSTWPILDMHFTDSYGTNATFDWEYVSAQLRRYEVQSFWRLLVQPNWQSVEQQIVYLMPPSFDFLLGTSMKRTYDDSSVYLYQRYIKYLMLDLDVRVRKAINIAEEIVDFEKELISLMRDEDSLVLQSPQTLAELSRQLPNIDFHKYFSILFAGIGGQLPADYDERLLIVADVDYLLKLSKLLRRTTAETIAKYLLVQFLTHFEVHLHEDETLNEQREHCLQKLNNYLPQELTQLFLELQHDNGLAFLRRTDHIVSNFFGSLKTQFEKMLNSTNIFEKNELTRNLGLQKIRSIRLLLPTLDSSVTAKLRSDLSIKDNYDENILNLSKERARQKLRMVEKSFSSRIVDSYGQTETGSAIGSTTYGPLDVNAYYRLKKNYIEIPIGILQPPIYYDCTNSAKIYGSFVYIVAHELLHGFDFDGLNYNKEENVANYWDAKSIIKFGTKSSCFLADRYQNAILTINENIADSEGLRLALEIFKQDLSNKRFEQRQDDLKMFFIGFAQTWCGGDGSSTSTNRLNSSHAAHRERVNNVVGNFPEFAEVFKCKAGSEMHPDEKCRIW